MTYSPQNPVGITGFDFIEFSSKDPSGLEKIFRDFGFSKKKKVVGKEIYYYHQNDIHFLINNDPDSAARAFNTSHGPCASATGWRVHDAQKAFEVALSRGAKPAPRSDYTNQTGDPLPGIVGVGGSTIYFIDNHDDPQRWEKLCFEDLPEPDTVAERGFFLIDHLTNNVHQGQLEPLANFYKNVFGFTEVRYFDIDGKQTGLLSYALRSPCGSFCIPINESKDEKSQIQEYLNEYNGEGIQHIAFLTPNILKTMETLKDAEIETLDIDADYYNEVFKKVPGVTEDHQKIQDFNLLVDGNSNGYLIQIFTKNLIGPIFFEFIQRKNHSGFGEGNFGALFRAIERDQEKRGVL
mgnify:CR=1 FL=1